MSSRRGPLVLGPSEAGESARQVRLLAAAMLCLVAAWSPAIGVAEEPRARPVYHSPVYHSEGQQFLLEPSVRQVALRLAEASAGSELGYLEDRLRAVAHRDLSVQGLRLYTLGDARSPGGMRRLLDELRGSSAVELVAPVYESAGALMIVTDQFLVSLAPGVGEDELLALNRRHGVEIVRRAGWDDRTWVLRTPHGDSLATANRYHVSPLTAWAHPDFVRVMDGGESVRPEDDGRLVLGPDGRALTGEVEPTKGTSAWRVLERASFVAPEGVPSIPMPEPMANVSKVQITNQTFEANFPSGWFLSGEPTWDDVRYRKSSGSWSGYGVGSGVSPPGPYPSHSNAWLIYGPFDLTNADEARVNLDAWVRTESFVDVLFVGASTNSANYSGKVMSGDWAAKTGGNGFMNVTIDFVRDSGLDLSTSDKVWLGIAFISDSSVELEGAYVDNIVLEKITGGFESVSNDVVDAMQWSLNNNRQLWGTAGADIRAPQAWGITEGSDTITVAVIDEGVDTTHPDLTGKFVQGYDATGGGSGGKPSGDEAQGTNIAGVAAAITDNLEGVAGIAKHARIMPVRVVVGGTTQDSWLADGISWAVDQGADVLSNGWGGGTASSAVTNAIKDARNLGRGGRGSIVVSPAGDDNGSVQYPATLSETLAVGSLSPCDERTTPTSCDGEFWWGGNYGSKLDLSAPGVDMWSTDISGASGYDPGDYHFGFSGTPASAAVVSGVAALVLAWDPGLTASQLENRLTTTADDIGSSGFDNQTGHGRVNAYEALLATTPSTLLTINRQGAGTGTVTSDPAAINCGNTCVAGFANGAVVTLTATPELGSTFGGWSGHADCSDGVVTMNVGKTCTATFDLIPSYMLTVTRNGSGTGTVISSQPGISCGSTCQASYLQATPVDLFGYPDMGFQLDGWSGNGDCNDGSLTMNGARSCTATFSPCAGTSQLNVTPQTITWETSFEACNSITVGQGFAIGAGGDVVFEAGNTVVLDNGFSVLSGGEATFVTGTPASQ